MFPPTDYYFDKELYAYFGQEVKENSDEYEEILGSGFASEYFMDKYSDCVLHVLEQQPDVRTWLDATMKYDVIRDWIIEQYEVVDSDTPLTTEKLIKINIEDFGRNSRVKEEKDDSKNKANSNGNSKKKANKKRKKTNNKKKKAAKKKAAVDVKSTKTDIYDEKDSGKQINQVVNHADDHVVSNNILNETTHHSVTKVPGDHTNGNDDDDDEYTDQLFEIYQDCNIPLSKYFDKLHKKDAQDTFLGWAGECMKIDRYRTWLMEILKHEGLDFEQACKKYPYLQKNIKDAYIDDSDDEEDEDEADEAEEIETDEDKAKRNAVIDKIVLD